MNNKLLGFALFLMLVLMQIIGFLFVIFALISAFFL